MSKVASSLSDVALVSNRWQSFQRREKRTVATATCRPGSIKFERKFKTAIGGAMAQGEVASLPVV